VRLRSRPFKNKVEPELELEVVVAGTEDTIVPDGDGQPGHAREGGKRTRDFVRRWRLGARLRLSRRTAPA